MGKAENASPVALRESVERGSFHLDSKYPSCSCCGDRLGGLTERRVSCPARADDSMQSRAAKCASRHCNQIGVCLTVVRRREIVIAGSFVAQRAFDDDKIWSWSDRRDLACGCHTHQEPAAAREQLFRDQDRK